MKDFHYLGIVRLTPNVALRGTATQSETHINYHWAPSPFVASYANDGNFETSMTQISGACSFAERNAPVWWQVDLLKVYEITKVAITGRKEYGKCVFNNYYVCGYIFTISRSSLSVKVTWARSRSRSYKKK